MIRVVYVVALCLGAIVASQGCVADDRSAVDSEIVIGGEQCGSKVCTGKTFCCNASCGICAPIGGGCTQQACLVDEDSDIASSDDLLSTPAADSEVFIGPQQCGKVTCTGGTRCCNASCGTCVLPGHECTQQVCEPTD
jgi:hypothetical protein